MARAAVLSSLFPAVLGAGKYQVKTVADKYIGGMTSGGSQDAFVLYPVGAEGEKFPLVSFAHGNTAGGAVTVPAYTGLLKAWASYGYVIVAIKACPGVACIYQDTEAFAADQLHAADVALELANSTDPIWKLVDGRFAIGGHSMGGVATVYNAARQGARAKWLAAVPLHPCPVINKQVTDVGKIARPMFYGTGSKDTICSVPAVRASFDGTAPPKAFMEIAGATHLEPNTGRREDDFPAHFLDCHVKADEAACELVYGNAAGDMCKGGMDCTVCVATRGGPAPPPGPGPAPAPPAPVPPTPPVGPSVSCVAELEKDCGDDKGNAIACAGCVTRNVAALRAAGCSIKLGTHDDSYDWCHQS